QTFHLLLQQLLLAVGFVLHQGAPDAQRADRQAQQQNHHQNGVEQSWLGLVRQGIHGWKVRPVAGIGPASICRRRGLRSASGRLMAAGYQPVGGLSVDFLRWMGYRVSVKVLKCSRTIIIMDSVSWPECFRSGVGRKGEQVSCAASRILSGFSSLYSHW